MKLGRRFGRLVVLRLHDTQNGTRSFWCRCDCGVEKPVIDKNLMNGSTMSCGCLRREKSAAWMKTLSTGNTVNLRHGHHRHHLQSRTYHSWTSMIQRCTNPKASNYARYGGAGVMVCPEWMTFAGFLASMGERPKGTTLSRFGDIGNYELGNCAWHTPAQQLAEARKKRQSRAVSSLNWNEFRKPPVPVRVSPTGKRALRDTLSAQVAASLSWKQPSLPALVLA
jgi:hypothetical protein